MTKSLHSHGLKIQRGRGGWRIERRFPSCMNLFLFVFGPLDRLLQALMVSRPQAKWTSYADTHLPAKTDVLNNLFFFYYSGTFNTIKFGTLCFFISPQICSAGACPSPLLEFRIPRAQILIRLVYIEWNKSELHFAIHDHAFGSKRVGRHLKEKKKNCRPDVLRWNHSRAEMRLSGLLHKANPP